MNSRQQNLLNSIINQYIKTAEPVGSAAILELADWHLSSATIRNEMAELEEDGYLFQPYTSAGRVPTEKSFCFYLENFLKERPLSKKEEMILKQTARKFRNSYLDLLKNLARVLSALTDTLVIVGFSKNNFYYTGLSNLFSQPEFAVPGVVLEIGEIVDHLDRTIAEIFPEIQEIKIFVGHTNPFSQKCGTILTKYRFKREVGLLGILGPIRMDYENNLALLKEAQRIVGG